MIYALLIHSYPTAIMNFCLVLINLYYLIKTSRVQLGEYDLVKTKANDELIDYLLNNYHDDILYYFPNLDFDEIKANQKYIVMHENKPVGFTVGTLNDDNLDLLLDYTIKEYRDFSIGNFLYDQLKKDGIKTISCSNFGDNHLSYLEKMNFKKVDDKYIKTL